MTAMQPIPGARATLSRVQGGVEVSIPVRRRAMTVFILVIWLAMWVLGQVSVIGSLVSGAPLKGPPPGFLVVWLIGWSLGGIAVFAFLLWTLFGRELVRFLPAEVSLRREALGVGLTRRYQSSAVNNLRAVESASLGPMFGSRDPFGIYGGSVAFDYGSKTVRFGAGVDYAESHRLVSDVLAIAPAFAPR